MNTLLLSCVYDSIVAKMSCVCDSVLVKSCERGCRSITEIHQAGTNCQDVYIVLIICVAVVLVALIAKWALWSWKDAELEAKEKEREAQKAKEEEECRRKIQSNLLDKYLDFLKERTKGYSPDEKKTILPSANINQYRQVLEYLIELSQNNQLNTISEEKLNPIFNEE